MTLARFVQIHRNEIDKWIWHKLGVADRMNDDERARWVKNDQDLRDRARKDGVRL